MDYLALFGLLIALDYIYFRLKYSRPNGPPAFYGLPFIGLLPLHVMPRPVFRFFYKIFLERLPDVFVARMFHPVVFVKNRYIMEVQKNDACLSRPAAPVGDFIGFIVGKKPGWVYFDGAREDVDWKSARRINLRGLLGLPKRQKFARIAECVNIFVARMEEKSGEFWKYDHEMLFSLFQTASNLNLGRTLESNNIQSFLDGLLRLNSRLTLYLAVISFVPLKIIKFAERFINSPLKPIAMGKIYREFWWKVVSSVKPGFTEPTNYIEAVLQSKEPREASNYIQENIFLTLLAETIAILHSMATVLSHIALNPHQQEQLREEVVRVVGGDELSAEHLERMPYLRAAVNETYRISTPVIAVSRYTTEKTKIGQYSIPANINVTLCFHSELYDPEYFPDPYVFKPERFLDDEGNFKDHPMNAPFSRGGRRCPGHEVSTMTVQVYLAKIVQYFEIIPFDKNFKVQSEFDGGFRPELPKLPLKFVRRPEAPPIDPVALPAGLTEILQQVMEDDKHGKLN